MDSETQEQKATRVAEALGWHLGGKYTYDRKHYVEVLREDGIASIAALLTERDNALALATAPMLSREQPCGCIVCQCESERCSGCGAKRCGSPDCVFLDPLLRKAVFQDAPTYMQIRAELAAARATIDRINEAHNEQTGTWAREVERLRAENDTYRLMVGEPVMTGYAEFRKEEPQP